MDKFDKVDQYIKEHRKNPVKSMDFAAYLYSLMDKKGIDKGSDVYKKAFISKQVYSNIVSSKAVPSLSTCVKLALALNLDNKECKYLMKKAGYTLASDSDLSLIIRYLLDNKIYDLYEANDYLSHYGYDDFLKL
ncbi:MAG: helix-turn-helix transcriptional regulator [Bacilli bacterium]|nr:helix-turn-helix transcriptional regulator [Bacilli bacterium]